MLHLPAGPVAPEWSRGVALRLVSHVTLVPKQSLGTRNKEAKGVSRRKGAQATVSPRDTGARAN